MPALEFLKNAKNSKKHTSDFSPQQNNLKFYLTLKSAVIREWSHSLSLFLAESFRVNRFSYRQILTMRGVLQEKVCCVFPFFVKTLPKQTEFITKNVRKVRKTISNFYKQKITNVMDSNLRFSHGK